MNSKHSIDSGVTNKTKSPWILNTGEGEEVSPSVQTLLLKKSDDGTKDDHEEQNK